MPRPHGACWRPKPVITAAWRHPIPQDSWLAAPLLLLLQSLDLTANRVQTLEPALLALTGVLRCLALLSTPLFHSRNCSFHCCSPAHAQPAPEHPDRRVGPQQRSVQVQPGGSGAQGQPAQGGVHMHMLCMLDAAWAQRVRRFTLYCLSPVLSAAAKPVGLPVPHQARGIIQRGVCGGGAAAGTPDVSVTPSHWKASSPQQQSCRLTDMLCAGDHLQLTE